MFFVLGVATMTPEFVQEFSNALNELTIVGRITLFLSIVVIGSAISLTVMSICKSWRSG